MIKLRYPVISAQRPGGDYALPADPIRQVQSYMYQLVDELNVALQSVETQVTEAKQTASAAASSGGDGTKAAQNTFNAIKSLIIKSADIVNAYYETISKRLEGQYVAQSDFGTYSESTTQTIEANSKNIDLMFENIQQIISDVEGVENTIIEVNAHIRPGILYYDGDGIPVYGLEIGQRTEVNGQEVFHKYARFTSDKLSFYDSNDNEVAYVSDKKLFITQVEVTGAFKIGRLVDTAQADGSVVTRYIAATGGEE